MDHRYDHLHKVNGQSLHEQFYYDCRNQLTDTYLNGTLAGSITYDNLGNITSKSKRGGMEYQSGTSPYQLTGIVPDQNIDPGYKLSQNITYTDFNKFESITGNGYKLEIGYGLGNQRISQSLSSVNQYGLTNLLLKKHFTGGLQEKIFYETGTEKTISYITSPEGLTAIEVKSGIISEWYTVLIDHLGSITTLIRESDGSRYELSYDAWGNRRNPANWTNYSGNLPDFIAITDSDFITDRGFTGHEHLDMFGLINMNGRVYDPVASRFLSPDSFIQTPELALNYNGYVYCLNNPLVYTDPDGEFFLGTLLTFSNDFLATIFLNGGIDPWNTSEGRGEAWKKFDPSATWSKTNKAFKIDIGGFKTDPNRTIIGGCLQLISRWTWELPQTFIGKEVSHIRNMSGNVDNVDYYGGATLVNRKDKSDDSWGFTLGPYINSKNVAANPYTDDLFRHEYGHTLQSRAIGPLYIIKVGLPSIISGTLDEIDLFSHNHDRSWFETQANRMAFKYFSNHEPNALSSNKTLYGPRQGPKQLVPGTPWNNTKYPRKDNPTWYWMFYPPDFPWPFF